jgi:thymidylate synthase
MRKILYKMNNLDKKYTDLLQDILDNGVKKETRNGGTISVFGRQIRHNMSEGFPLLTTKKMAWKTMVTELLWFLRGDTNIKYLVDNDCHIWDGDAYKNYKSTTLENDMKKSAWELTVQSMSGEKFILSQEEFIEKIKTDDEFAKKWGELGPVYGKQWRSWTKFEDESIEHNEWYKSSESIDQIANLINDLKTNPDSRRLMVNAWNVGELDQMVLPPCHYGFQVYTRELSELERHDIKEQYGFDCRKLAKPSIKQLDDANIPTRAISLMWSQRSVDTLLGLPFNIASYGLLLMMIADEVNMVPDELIGNLGDVHLYSNHIEQAKEQIGRELTLEERSFIASSNHSEVSQNIKMFTGIDEDHTLHKHLDDVNIPTRTREPYPLPTVHVRDGIFCSSVNDIILENYQSHPTIKAPLSN